MKRIKQGFSPMANNTIRVFIKGPDGMESKIFQTTTQSEAKLIEGMITSQVKEADKL